MKRGLPHFQIGNQFLGPVNRHLIAYREQYALVPRYRFVDLLALLTHGQPVRFGIGAALAGRLDERRFEGPFVQWLVEIPAAFWSDCKESTMLPGTGLRGERESPVHQDIALAPAWDSFQAQLLLLVDRDCGGRRSSAVFGGPRRQNHSRNVCDFSSAVAPFLGLTPEFVVAPFGLSGLLPKFMGANPYLFFRRLCHFVAFSCERDRFRRRTFLRGRAVHRSLSQCEPLQLVPGFGRMAKALPTSRPSAPASISRGRSIRSILRNVRHSPSKSAFA